MTGSGMNMWTVSLVLGIMVILRECYGQSGVSVHLSHKDRKMNVQYFNDLRRDTGAADMNELTWDLSTAKAARRLGRTCDFVDRPGTEYSSALYKQMFDPTARPGEIIMNAIRFWASQKSNFTRYGWQSCTQRNTCEYIKMMAANAENAACSLTRCSRMRRQREDEEANMYFVTCLFSPTTDLTRPPFSTGRKCSRCPLYSECRRGLCSSNEKTFMKNKHKSRNKNRVVPLRQGDESSRGKGSVLLGHRYLDDKGNVRIGSTHRYLAQTARRPSYIYLPSRPSRQNQRRTRPGDRKSATRGHPAQSTRVKRQSDSDRRYYEMLRRRQEQRRREELERRRRERERQRLMAQQLRGRAVETRGDADLQRRIFEERRRRNEELRQREEERRRQEELRRREEERRRRERHRHRPRPQGPQRLETAGPMDTTDKFQLTQVHNTLRGTQLAELSWSNHLERWARYVIRCEIEYPGPIDTFTNFGKLDKTSRVYNMVYDWGAEGSDVNQRQNVGCRTPDDRERCNHNSIIRNPFIRNYACASLDCGSKTQLTCIYK